MRPHSGNCTKLLERDILYLWMLEENNCLLSTL